ncbi:MAG: polyphenol oxidase family protein [Candidatus Cloacimonadaceae bacterium]|nr:polyphenol oxidase family protein [Candidatus Cloacimonadaceae bacterium]
MKSWHHLGMDTPDYRGIMHAQKDFYVLDKLIPAANTVVVEQTHSDLIHICGHEDGGAGFGTHAQIAVADGMITNIPGQYLLIRTADCTPVLFLDKQNRAVGAVHSGREGTRKNIAGKAVKLMYQSYGIPPEDIIAYIGAGICTRHYQVNQEIWEAFNASMEALGVTPDLSLERHINIRLCIFQELILAGIPYRNIEQEIICTYESPRHFSYRRDGTRNRQINMVGIEYD